MKLVDRVINIATANGIAVSDMKGNEFSVCCIGHAALLSIRLTGQRILHRHQDIRFTILEEAIQEPRVVFVSTPTLTSYRIRFEGSVTAYAQSVTKIIDDDGLDQYQQVIKEIEHRVITGLMGATIPERISVQWDKDEALIVSWGDL